MRYGLCVGSADLIGMLAPQGRFLALEVKRPGEKPTKEQELFLELVRKSGGVAAVVTSVEEALAVVGDGMEGCPTAMSDVLRFVREARACVGDARWAEDDCLPCLDAALNRAELAATTAIDNGKGMVRP